ncbi:CHAT domain-containing protein [Nocardioides ultimimeridianus]
MPTGGWREVSALEELIAEASSELARDPEGARLLLDRASAHPDRSANDQATVEIETLLGTIAVERGEVGEAIHRFQRARLAALTVGLPLEERRALLGRTSALLVAGEYRDVITIVRGVLDGLEGESRLDEELATRLHLHAHRQLGAALAITGEFAAGVRSLDLADELARLIGDPFEVAQVGYLRGRKMLLAGMVHRGIEQLSRSRSQFLSIGAEVWADRVVVAIAEALTGIGRAIPAMELLEAVRPALEGHPRTIAEHDLARSGALLGAGLGDEACLAAIAARDAFRDMAHLGSAAMSELALARAAIRIGRFEAAHQALASAAAIARRCEFVQAAEQARLLQAAVAYAEGDQETADAIARQLRDATASPPNRAWAQLLIVRTTEDLDEAEELIADTAAIADRLGQPELRIRLRIERARHLRRTGALQEALDELRAAAEFVGSPAHNQLPGMQGHSPAGDATDLLVRMLLEDGGHASVTEAWTRVRRAKRVSLTVLHRHSDRWRVDGETDPAAVCLGLDELLERALSRTATGSIPIVTEAAPPVPQAAGIEYYVLGADIACFVLRDGFVSGTILRGVAAESARLTTAWQHECILMAATGPRDGDAGSAVLDALYDLLVAPVEDWLADLGDEPLQVLGHRHLHALPGAALLSRGAPWRERLPGVGQGPCPEPVAAAAPVATLVLAVPDDDAPGIGREAAMIAQTLPGAEVYVDGDATTTVLAKRADAVDVVHIAAHGRFRRGNPLYSAVHLGDGWLRAADLINGQVVLTGRVVVLSACVSGRSSDRMPDPIGLVWAALLAGAQGVVASLWPVDDMVTLQLMTRFYEALAQGRHPRTALADAQRAVAAEHPHPYFWAAFQYFANER